MPDEPQTKAEIIAEYEAERKDNNRALWDSFPETDLEYTKTVDFGHKYTAIDPHYQVMLMTERFGACGTGWGVEVVHGVERIDDDVTIATADVTLWYLDGGQRAEFGPIRHACQIKFQTNAGKTLYDMDAPKKALTGARSKALSWLGACSDVFLGMMEDVEYVNALRQRADEAQEQQSAKEKSLQDSLRHAITNAGIDKDTFKKYVLPTLYKIYDVTSLLDVPDAKRSEMLVKIAEWTEDTSEDGPAEAF